jgi:dihydrofolate reductase
MIAAIGAVSSNGMIGLNGWLPWDIPEELAYFEDMVTGAALVMGRLTYESMDVVPVDSFIVTSQRSLDLKPGCQAVNSVEKALLTAAITGKNVFVIGGAALYSAAWPYCQRFYLTRIERAFDGDCCFPQSIPLDRWKVIGETQKTYLERKTGLATVCRFVEYEQENPLSF